MSQWRQDPLSGRWVIIAADRGRRPNEFRLARRLTGAAAGCPFCPGHEQDTTPEILAWGRPDGAAADGPGWRQRVFPNKYPALGPDPESGPSAAGLAARPGLGAHEVVVYSPRHADGPTTLGPDGLADLLRLLVHRTRDLAADPGHRYVLAFVNHGPEAGATLAHPHGQIVATPVVPDTVAAKRDRFLDHRRIADGACLLCALAAQEERAGERLVAAGEHGVVLAPWASRLPYEMLLVPRRHGADPTGCADAELAGLAALLDRALAGLERRHPDPPLNLVLHGAPLVRGPGDEEAAAAFHWHLEVLPRLTRLAGFEAGTGFFINALPPETAVRRLRGEED
jgi:UDPglucose--hexose-1-phosphate uridylyltransferase